MIAAGHREWRGLLKVALISDVFYSADGGDRLRARLSDAKAMGAELAVLPEIPLHPWVPATRTARDEDAEAPDGPRVRQQAEAAKSAGIAVLGGTIVRNPPTGIRHNTAILFDARGEVVARYAKVHPPREEGFWETDHYADGDAPPSVVREFAVPLGIQICSDANRPEGSHILAALGAEAILVPRATERGTFERWRLVFRANAITSSAYVLSVNRPAPESGVPLGGPSIAIDPDGNVLLDTTDPIAVVTLDRSVVEQSRTRYPGYLPIHADVYARGWEDVVRSRKSEV